MLREFSIALLLVVCVQLSSAIRWKDCGSAGSKVNSVMVSGCEKTDVCNLKKGTNATFTVIFKSKEQVTKATAVVHGILAGIPVPFPLGNPDGCKNCGLKCPLTTASTYTYKTNIYIKPIFPSVKLTVKWELVDQSSNDIFCVYVSAAVVS